MDTKAAGKVALTIFASMSYHRPQSLTPTRAAPPPDLFSAAMLNVCQAPPTFYSLPKRGSAKIGNVILGGVVVLS